MYTSLGSQREITPYIVFMVVSIAQAIWSDDMSLGVSYPSFYILWRVVFIGYGSRLVTRYRS